MKSLRKLYSTSNKWQISYYFIICYASVFPLIGRYRTFFMDYGGTIKVMLLSLVFFVYVLSILIGKRYAISRKWSFFGLTYLAFIFCFFALVLIDIFDNNILISQSLKIFMGYAYYPIIVFFAYNEFKTKTAMKNLFSMVLIISVFMCIVGLIEWVVGPVALSSTGMKVLIPGQSLPPSLNPYVTSVEEIETLRVFSTLTDHQSYAAFLLLSVFTLLYFIFTSKNRLKYYFLLVFVFFSMMITYSLTALGGAILLCFFYFAGIFFITKYKRHLRNILLLIFAMVIVCLVGILLKFNERIVTGGILAVTDKTSGRLYLFLNGIKLFLNNPLGYGFTVTKMGSLWTSSDCYWLWTLLQLGMPLFVIYFLIYFYPTVVVFKVARRRKGMQNIQLSWLIFSLFIVNMFFLNFSNNLMMTGPSNLIFWVIVGASLNKNLFELA